MAEKKSKVVFMGTPDFAAGILNALLAREDMDVCAVYTQPDRPSGRGKKLVPSPVKKLALAHEIPCIQPETMKNAGEQQQLAAFEPDFLIVAAYGMLLPQAVLDIPRYVPINVHTSLLPAYRGSAPVQRAIMDGCRVTGVSIMRMDAGLDTGPVYRQLEVPCATETSGSLLARMADLSGPLLGEVLEDILAGRAVEHPQEGPTMYAAKLKKSEGIMTWERDALMTDARIRGLTPDPGAHTVLCFGDKKVPVVLEETAVAQDALPEGAAPGTILVAKGRLQIVCGQGAVAVRRLRPQGKKSMDIASFLNGMRLGGGVLSPIGTTE